MIPVNADAEFFVITVAMLIYLVGSAVLLVVNKGLNEDLNEEKWERWFITLKSLAILVHSIAILMRWVRVDHGPFINLYEILSSNIWSLSVITLLVYARIPSIRRTFHFCELTIVILVVWFMWVDPVESHLPPTYNTIWLYFHVVSGKFFLGLLLVSTSLAVASALRYLGVVSSGAEILYLNEVAYRFLAIAFLFESLMLLVGAIWAQDAWGRYWAWDPLETWALITWLTVIFILHVRAWINPNLASWLIPIAFVLAFLTFFGVPFYSTAPHKGMI